MGDGIKVRKTATAKDGTASTYVYVSDCTWEELVTSRYEHARANQLDWFRPSDNIFGYVDPVLSVSHKWEYMGLAGKGATLSEPEMTLDELYTEVKDRISWDQYGMQLAQTAALRADCTRRQVGAVLMAADHSIIATGYNGGPPKGKSCLKGECPRGRMSAEELAPDSAYDTGGGTCVALHAEWNVLLRTAWHQFEGSTLYVTDKPCHICQVLISGTHIARVVAPNYGWTRSYDAAKPKF